MIFGCQPGRSQRMDDWSHISQGLWVELMDLFNEYTFLRDFLFRMAVSVSISCDVVREKNGPEMKPQAMTCQLPVSNRNPCSASRAPTQSHARIEIAQAQLQLATVVHEAHPPQQRIVRVDHSLNWQANRSFRKK